MDETPNTSEVGELQSQCHWLRKQVQILLVLVILISATLTLFLWRQVRYADMDLAQIRPMLEEYNTKQAPAMDDFLRKLEAYGRKTPDFAGIYNKYNLGQAVQMAATNAPVKKP